MDFQKTLILGAGWLGNWFQEKIPDAELSKVRITDERKIDVEIERVRPDIIINCCGKTGNPNIDSLESDPTGTYLANTVGPILLAAKAKEHGIYLVHLSSGCMYEGTNNDKGFSEEDPPNFYGNVYIRSKILAEQALKDLGALQLRLRLPLCGRPHPRNLLTKLLNYKKVIQIGNSITVLEDFFPAALALIEKQKTGIYHIVNSGVEYHKDLLDLYRDLVDPKYRYETITMDILKNELETGRSNCLLSNEKLGKEGIEMPDIKDSMEKVVRQYGKKFRNDNDL